MLKIKKKKSKKKQQVRRGKINKQIPIRQCISCRKQLMRDELIRLTKTVNLTSGLEEIFVNPNKSQLGRSIYLCKSQQCINLAVKGKKIQKMLKVSIGSVEKILLDLEQAFNLIANASVLNIRKVVLAR